MTRASRLLGSGWIPALLVYVVSAMLLRESTHLRYVEIVAFTLWIGWAHTVPGTIVWRLVDWRGRSDPESAPSDEASRPAGRPFIEDVVLGTIAGVILAIPVYLGCVAVGQPRLVLAWPLLVIAPVLLRPAGRRLLVRRQAAPTPAWWSWLVALVMLYVTVYSLDAVWLNQPLVPANLQSPYIDEPYHLSLVAEFRHHFPPEVPYVDGTRLEYHWLFYPFAAAASWGASVEPVRVTLLLAPTALIAVMILGVAVAAARISSHRWAGPTAAAVLTMIGPLDVFAWTPDSAPWLNAGWLYYASPTQAMANALCPLLIVLLAGLINGTSRGRTHWVVAFIVMFAIAGAKSSMLPLFVAGLAGATVVMLVVHRRVPRTMLGLSASSIVAFGLARPIFYGSGSRGLEVGPFQIIDRTLADLGLVSFEEGAARDVQILLALVFVVCTAASLAGAVGLFVRGGWRQPLGWILLGAWVAGVGAYHIVAHPAMSQAYFFRSAHVPAAMLCSVGLVRLVGTPRRGASTALAATAVAGLGWVVVVTLAIPVGAPNHATSSQVALAFLLPIAAAAVGIAGIMFVLSLATRRLPTGRRAAPWVLPAIVTLILGMCATTAIVSFPQRFGWEHATPVPEEIPNGGLPAARWLRDHSHPDDLVATNVHSRWIGAPEDVRQFWISAYSERRVLVEGWAYIAPATVGLPSTDRNNLSTGPPFWDPERLRLNDEVFTDPTAENVAELHERYGVDWLFADRRRKPDLKGLRELADRRYRNETFVVFRIGERDRTSSR